MLKTLYLFAVLFLFSARVFAQDIKVPFRPDSNEIVFTMAERMPEYKYGNAVLADSIKASCARNHARLTESTYIINFVVTTKGILQNFQFLKKPDGNDRLDKAVQDAFAATSGQWNNATQNGRNIPCFARRTINIDSDGNINVQSR